MRKILKFILILLLHKMNKYVRYSNANLHTDNTYYFMKIKCSRNMQKYSVIPKGLKILLLICILMYKLHKISK